MIGCESVGVTSFSFAWSARCWHLLKENQAPARETLSRASPHGDPMRCGPSPVFRGPPAARTHDVLGYAARSRYPRERARSHSPSSMHAPAHTRTHTETALSDSGLSKTPTPQFPRRTGAGGASGGREIRGALGAAGRASIGISRPPHRPPPPCRRRKKTARLVETADRVTALPSCLASSSSSLSSSSTQHS